ncbi:MAG: hypothetical protein AAGH74_12865 [Pseudomonadota bacterium]
MVTSEKVLDPADVVLAQDKCLTADGVDYARWLETVFIPLSLISEGKSFHIESDEAFVGHLKALEEKAFELGVVALETQILSHVRPSVDMAILSSIRRRLGANDEVIGESSITWTVIRVGEGWRVNQIFFNDSVYDPSIVGQVFLGRSNKK